MLFDEVYLKIDLGCKILPGHLVVGKFGPEQQTSSLVAISQTLDKLVVHEFPTDLPKIIPEEASQYFDKNLTNLYYISVKNVIKTIALRSLKISTTGSLLLSTSENLNNILPNGNSITATAATNNPKSVSSRDLLMVGCANSILIYDVFSQNNLLNIITPTAINAITSDEIIRENIYYCSSNQHVNKQDDKEVVAFSNPIEDLCICAGPQKIYSLKFDSNFLVYDSGCEAEISSERSTGDIINCLIQGCLNGLDFVITGSIEQKIRLYQVDSFNQNISICVHTIEESSQINCLCSINTLIISGNNPRMESPTSTAAAKMLSKSFDYDADDDLLLGTKANSPLQANSILPSIGVGDAQLQSQVNETISNNNELLIETNYFAYGLENGFIGVYRLLQGKNEKEKKRFLSERLWRHKTKHTPLIIIMFDINGDGLDELVIGYKNSRIEGRAPFTGQLLTTTKCFKSDHLAGLAVINNNQQRQQQGCGSILLACSTNGQVVCFKSKLSRPRQPLQGYKIASQTTDSQLDYFPFNKNWADSFLDSGGSKMHANFTSITNSRTIAETEQENFFSKEDSSSSLATNLHIESHLDDTKATKCDVKQSFDYLQKINQLYCNQLELESKACEFYHKGIYKISNLCKIDISIEHGWNFDETTFHLKLIIFVGTRADEFINLIKIEDESRNLIANGFLFAKSTKIRQILQSGDENTDNERRLNAISFSLRCKENLATRLKLSVFCQSNRSMERKQSTLSRVYNYFIDVPKFAMFTFAKRPSSSSSAIVSNNSNKNLIRMKFQLQDESKIIKVSNWLEKNFLCFQFRPMEEYIDLPKVELEGLDHLELLKKALSGNFHNKSRSSSTTNENKSTGDFQIELIDIKFTLKKMANPISQVPATTTASDSTRRRTTSSSIDYEEEEEVDKISGCKFTELSSTLRIAVSNGTLEFESESSDLVVDLVQSLMIDRLHLKPSSDKLQKGEVVANLEPLLNELEIVSTNCRKLEESERRIQTELYESADYTKNLMQQFAISNELNEFATSKELLNELNMMLNGTQTAARAHSLNNKSRTELSKQINELRGKISFLSGQPD